MRKTLLSKTKTGEEKADSTCQNNTMRSLNLTLLTDLYEITMMQGYFKTGNKDIVIFDAFYRENPSGSGYAIACGLEQVIEYIKNLQFSTDDIRYLESLHMFDEDF